MPSASISRTTTAVSWLGAVKHSSRARVRVLLNVSAVCIYTTLQDTAPTCSSGLEQKEKLQGKHRSDCYCVSRASARAFNWIVQNKNWNYLGKKSYRYNLTYYGHIAMGLFISYSFISNLKPWVQPQPFGGQKIILKYNLQKRSYDSLSEEKHTRLIIV